MNKIIYTTFNAFALIVLFTFAGCKKKEVDLTKAFVKYYGGLKADVGAEVLQTSDGGYVISGTSNLGTSDVDNYDIIVIKTDGQGNEKWHKTFGSANYDESGSLAIMPDGGYIVVGTYGTTSRNWRIDALEAGKDSTVMVAIRLDASGNTLWERKYPYSSPFAEIGTFGKTVVVNSDGTCFLGGMVDSSYAPSSTIFVNLDLFALVIDANGNYIQVGGFDMKPLRYGASDQQDYMFSAIKAFSNSGDEYLISSSTKLSGNETPRLVKCRMNGIALTQNNAPSKSQWNSSPGSAGLLTAAQICRTGDNNYMMTGTSGASSANSDFYMFKLDGMSLNDAGISFLKFYGGDRKDAGVSIIATSDGGYAILATTNSTVYTKAEEKLDDVLLIKLSSSGDQEWAQVFGGAGNDIASRVIQTQDGGFLICGTIAFGDDVSNSGASNSVTLIKVNSAGELSNLK